MLLIPVTFVPAMALLLLLIKVKGLSTDKCFSQFLPVFLGFAAFQFLLIGCRFGYGWDQARLIQPLIAALIPPLAYLSFQSPRWLADKSKTSYLLHLLPLIVVLLSICFARYLIDLSLGVVAIFYAGLLTKQGLRGQDELSWVALNLSKSLLLWLWMVVLFLLMSGLTDVTIAADNWRNQGINIPSIVGLVSVFGLLGSLSFLLIRPLANLRNKPNERTALESEQAVRTVENFTQLLDETKLHHDPDLTLNKVARKLGVPARQVSDAVNRVTHLNVSTFINNRRIEDVCIQLQDSDLTITEIMYRTGFNTKSNFNQQFKRVMSVSPSQWRRSASITNGV